MRTAAKVPAPAAELLATIPSASDSRELRLYLMAGGGFWLGEYTRSRGSTWHAGGHYLVLADEQLPQLRAALELVEAAP